MKSAAARVTLDLILPEYASAILNSIKPETAMPPSARSMIKINKKGKLIEINFKANDVVALRASMNSILRYILGIWNTLLFIKKIKIES